MWKNRLDLPRSFCAMGMINDAVYTAYEPGRRTDKGLKQSPHLYRRNNVDFEDGSREKNAMSAQWYHF